MQGSESDTGKSWRLLLFIGLGLVIGLGLHLLQRRAKPARKALVTWMGKRPNTAEKRPEPIPLVDDLMQILDSGEEEAD
jgi:LPXTG-motif cell wall-anchored protein